MSTTKKDEEIIGNFENNVINKKEHNRELEIAKTFKKNGVDIEIILKSTRLTREEVEKL